jgi:hypothetical protein
MFQLLIVAPFLLFPLVIAVVLSIVGYKKGWKFGVVALGGVVLASGLGYLTAWLFVRVFSGMRIVGDIKRGISDVFFDLGISDLAWEGVFEYSLNRVVLLVLIPVFLIGYYIMFCVVWAIVSSVRGKKTIEKPPPAYKPVGLVCGILAAVVAVWVGLFASGINVVGEAGRAGRMVEILRPVNFNRIDVLYVSNQLPELMGLYFDTSLIAADEAARAELLADVINGVFVSSMDDFNSMLIVRPSRENFMHDINNLNEFVRFANRQGFINHHVFSNDELFNFETELVFGRADELSYHIFNFTFSPELVRTVLTVLIREISGNATFVYPLGIITNDSQADFAGVLHAVNQLTDFLDGKTFHQMTETERNETLDAMNVIRNSPLFPTHVFSYLMDVLQ